VSASLRRQRFAAAAAPHPLLSAGSAILSLRPFASYSFRRLTRLSLIHLRSEAFFRVLVFFPFYARSSAGLTALLSIVLNPFDQGIETTLNCSYRTIRIFHGT